MMIFRQILILRIIHKLMITRIWNKAQYSIK